MQLHHSSWPEIEAYLTHSSGLIVPIGSTEQHGPNGLIGTDSICPELIAKRVGDLTGALIAPTFNVGSAQHHLSFPGTITLRPTTMIAAIQDWTWSLVRHGFKRIYWLNGHGGNVAPIQAAFTEIYADYSLRRNREVSPRFMLRNWWQLPNVTELCKDIFPVGDGRHATASEVSVSYFACPRAHKAATMSPKIAPVGEVRDADDYRRQFPDGRIGSDPSQASPEKGERIVDLAVTSLMADYNDFLKSN